MDEADPVAVFASLPGRVYLDTAVLQRLWDFGGVVFEGEALDPTPREAGVAHLPEDLEALRRIFEVNERAQFEFVVTRASLHEVEARGRAGYTQWVRDVEDTWLVQSGGVQHEPVDLQRLGSVSGKDWLLLLDALGTGCDAFLTVDRPLASQARIMERQTGLRILLPGEHWSLLARWAPLWR